MLICFRVSDQWDADQSRSQVLSCATRHTLHAYNPIGCCVIHGPSETCLHCAGRLDSSLDMLSDAEFGRKREPETISALRASGILPRLGPLGASQAAALCTSHPRGNPPQSPVQQQKALQQAKPQPQSDGLEGRTRAADTAQATGRRVTSKDHHNGQPDAHFHPEAARHLRCSTSSESDAASSLNASKSGVPSPARSLAAKAPSTPPHTSQPSIKPGSPSSTGVYPVQSCLYQRSS